MSTRKPQNRVFVVGCSRGGTTMVQSILANHPEVSSFPETNILKCLLDDFDFRRFGKRAGRRRIPYYLAAGVLNRLGYLTGLPWRAYEQFLDVAGRPELRYMIPRNTRRMDVAVDAFVAILDTIATTPTWVEKTPQNVFCLDLVEKYIPDAKVIHVVRDGRDNVASLLDAAEKYGAFRARFGPPNGTKRAVEYWNRSLLSTVRHCNRANHVVVRYEDVVTAPADALSGVAELVGIQLSEKMFRYQTDGITVQRERWKERNTDRLEMAESKYYTALSEAERALVDRQVLSADDYFPLRFHRSKTGHQRASLG